jgi:hypothetical protein
VDDGLLDDYRHCRNPGVDIMKTETAWAEDAKRLLRREMAARGLTYDNLVERLAAIGVTDTVLNVRNKVSRGKFTAVFLLQALRAMGVRSLRLEDDGD